VGAGKRVLEYNGKKYDMETLLLNHYEKIGYEDGEVVNHINGEMFDIANITDKFVEINEGLMENCDHLTYNQRNRIKKLINNKLNKYRLMFLNSKFDKGMITKTELEELIFRESGKNVNDEYERDGGIRANLINKFVKLNQDCPLPKEIKPNEAGRFLRLIEVLVHQNKIFKKPHGNSSEPTKKELMEHLSCGSNSTFKAFVDVMEKHDLIRRFKMPNSRFIIFINPIYAHKDLIISRELYNVFKDILEAKLDKKILYYLEMIYENSNTGGSITYKDEK